MNISECVALLALISLGIAACVPARPATSQQVAPGSQPAPAAVNRTLVGSIRTEPDSLAIRPLLSGLLASFALSRRMFNADLALLDERGKDEGAAPPREEDQ